MTTMEAANQSGRHAVAAILYGLLEEAQARYDRHQMTFPLAIAAIKRQLETSWNLSLREALDEEAGAQSRAFETEDLREGAKAFIERRPARFEGR